MRLTEREVADMIGGLVRADTQRFTRCGEYVDGPGLCLELDNGQHFDVAVVERISRRVHEMPTEEIAAG